jgi:apolipoprotein N-acyltransferase
LDVPILTGALGLNFEAYEAYNAAFLFLPHVSQVQHYYKTRLVPMSERVPFNTVLPFLADLTMGRAGSFTPGRERTTFHLPLGCFATLICYESIFPDFARTFVARGAELLVIITNDAWFGPWSSASQHAHMAAFRAVEHRIAVARSANTGISTFVDPCGRMIGSLELSTRGITIKDVPLRQGRTFFCEYGNLFSQSCVAAVLAMLAWVFVERASRRKGR